MNLSKVLVVLAGCLTLFFAASCKKEEQLIPENEQRDSDPVFCGEATVSDLIADYYVQAGNVTVNNDATNLYVTINAESGWTLDEISMYVGDASSVPLTNAGEAEVSSFPYNVTCDPNTNTYTFILPLSQLNPCFIVSVNAEMSNTNQATSHNAWSAGTNFNAEVPGSYFDVCVQECETENEPEEEGCSMSQGFWFASPVAVWPSSGVTVAGYTYTEAEAKAIWNTSNANGIADSKKAFTQVATIYLSSSTVAPSATVWVEVAVCETWLSTLGKLSPSNLPTGNNTVAVAAGNIGGWVDANHCQ